MQGSAIRCMYAGFALIIIMFVVTVAIMLRGMNQIHSIFESVSTAALPLVSLIRLVFNSCLQINRLKTF